MGNESDGAPYVRDVVSDSDEATYECLTCGWNETRRDHPGTCPECSGDVRNLGMPIE